MPFQINIQRPSTAATPRSHPTKSAIRVTPSPSPAVSPHRPIITHHFSPPHDRGTHDSLFLAYKCGKQRCPFQAKHTASDVGEMVSSMLPIPPRRTESHRVRVRFPNVAYALVYFCPFIFFEPPFLSTLKSSLSWRSVVTAPKNTLLSELKSLFAPATLDSSKSICVQREREVVNSNVQQMHTAISMARPTGSRKTIPFTPTMPCNSHPYLSRRRGLQDANPLLDIICLLLPPLIPRPKYTASAKAAHVAGFFPSLALAHPQWGGHPFPAIIYVCSAVW